jgi:ferritin-like metal-binding protein YciE
MARSSLGPISSTWRTRASLLEENLSEEKAADEKLSSIAETVNPMAAERAEAA